MSEFVPELFDLTMSARATFEAGMDERRLRSLGLGPGSLHLRPARLGAGKQIVQREGGRRPVQPIRRDESSGVAFRKDEQRQPSAGGLAVKVGQGEGVLIAGALDPYPPKVVAGDLAFGVLARPTRFGPADHVGHFL